jgi:hypothetical protein
MKMYLFMCHIVYVARHYCGSLNMAGSKYLFMCDYLCSHMTEKAVYSTTM